jgi:hypothetical protein
MAMAGGDRYFSTVGWYPVPDCAAPPKRKNVMHVLIDIFVFTFRALQDAAQMTDDPRKNK